MAWTVRMAGNPGRGHHCEGPHGRGPQPSQRRRRAHYSKDRSRRNAAATQSRDQQMRQAADREGRMKVLSVEHDDDNLYMLKRRLERSGNFEVVAAEDSEQGCELAVTERPDVILIDLEMPVMDRWEPVRSLKKDPRTRNIQIIGMSAYAEASEREKALATGCDEFDAKPIKFENLLTTVRRVLAKPK